MTYLLTLRIRAGKGTSSYQVLLEREIPLKRGAGLGPIVLPEDARVLDVELRDLRKVVTGSLEEEFTKAAPYYEVVSEEEMQDELSKVERGNTYKPGFAPRYGTKDLATGEVWVGDELVRAMLRYGNVFQRRWHCRDCGRARVPPSTECTYCGSGRWALRRSIVPRWLYRLRR